MKALVYHGANQRAWEEKPQPALQKTTDAIVKISKTTICGTDLHIMKGDLPKVVDGRILGHEGVGVVVEAGAGVANFKTGDRVVISCVTSCVKCAACKKGMPSHCADGGWVLGYLIDGTQAEFVRIPHADGSLYPIPADVTDEEPLVLVSDILPTGFECGVLNGQIKPGDTVAIVGAGPVGLSALLTAQFYSPAEIIMVDLDANRLEVARTFGATQTVSANAVEEIMKLTGGRESTWPSRPWAHPSPFRSASPSWPPAAGSPTSACTARVWSCTWRRCGTAISPSPPAWSTP